MKIVLVGPSTEDGREYPVKAALRQLLATLGPQDSIVHTRRGIGALVEGFERQARSAERRRWPHFEVQPPEIGRYARAEAFRQNAGQLLAVHSPQVVLWTGDDPEQEEVAPLLAMAKAYPGIATSHINEFVAERARA